MNALQFAKRLRAGSRIAHTGDDMPVKSAARHKSRTTCYMCESPATSREHAPPLCIFPERKDMQDGIDYRQNLITVPACDEHNLRKSADDEYLQLILIHGYFNNPLAEKQFMTKLLRAFRRRPALLAQLHRENTPVVVGEVETAAVTIDRRRFERSLEMIVRALHFHTFKERLLEPMRMHTTLLLDMESDVADANNEMVKKFCAGVRELIGDAPALGDNPNVFWFKYKRLENSCGWHLCFYGGFDVLVLASPRFADDGLQISAMTAEVQ
jgi:hypothetical protein